MISVLCNYLKFNYLNQLTEKYKGSVVYYYLENC